MRQENPYVETDRRMVGDIYTSREVMDNLTVLCDDFGSRFAGTPEERQAADFIADTFTRYVVGSPSIWWGDRAIMKDAEEFVASEKAPDAKVFMSVGALEERGGEDASFAMVTNMFQLETLLRSAKFEELELRTYLVPNATHTTVAAINFIRGFQSVYGRPETSFLMEFMTPPPDQR